MKLQQAVKKETLFVLTGTAVMTALVLVVWYLFHKSAPYEIPWDYKVILSAVIGCGVAVLNFFMMALTVQNVVESDQQEAYNKMKVSYRYRMLLQLGWLVLSMVLPCFRFAAGFIPILLPSILIKGRGILSAGKKQASGDGQISP